MNSTIIKRLQRALAVGLVLVFILIPFSNALTATSDHGGIPATGIVCTTNASATFTLTALDGYIHMTDGNTVYTWSFSEGRDDFQFPGPVLCVNEGDTVTIVLHNTLPVDTSLVFPGQENVLANDLPSQPQFDVLGQMTSLTQVAVANGGSITYSFVASRPGTFVYESGTNPGIQVPMGLFGALIVRPAAGANFVYNDTGGRSTEFNPQAEILMLLSEIDPILNKAIERGETFDLSQYHPRYFLINGRAFPDTIAPNNASWLPEQPYGSLAHILPYDAVNNPLPALSRYIGVGSKDYPFHPHAFNGIIVGRDGYKLVGSAGEDLSYESFSMAIGPAQTWDVLFAWEDEYGFDPETNPLPVELPGDQNAAYGVFYGSAYLGNQDVLPTGTTSYNQCGEFYHIAHNHALQQLVGWGTIMTGMTTFTRVDPPQPNNCPVN